MWNAENSANQQLENHSLLTYCLNISLMVHKNDIFLIIANYTKNEFLNEAVRFFPTFNTISFIVRKNDQFWYATRIMKKKWYEISNISW